MMSDDKAEDLCVYCYDEGQCLGCVFCRRQFGCWPIECGGDISDGHS